MDSLCHRSPQRKRLGPRSFWYHRSPKRQRVGPMRKRVGPPSLSLALRVRVLVVAVLLAVPGCAQWNLGESLPFYKSEPKPQTPDNVLAVWTDATLNQPGKPTVRGFGGRVMFFVEGNESKAVPVEGSVAVYAFDDDRLDQEQPSPETRVVFPAANLALHQSDSALGPSYSFWLPWDNDGGPQRRISLLTRFEDKSGKIVMSKTARVTLPGTSAAAAANARVGNQQPISAPEPPGGVQQAGYQHALSQNVQQQARDSGVRQAAYQHPLPVSFHAQTQEPAVPGQRGDQEMHAPSLMTSTFDVSPDQAQRLLAGQATTQTETTRNPGTPWGPLTVSQQTIPVGLTASPANPAAPSAFPSAQASAARALAEQQPPGAATRSGRERSPARTATATLPSSDPVRRQPHHAEWLRPLPPTPRSGWTTQLEASSPGVAPAEH